MLEMLEILLELSKNKKSGVINFVLHRAFEQPFESLVFMNIRIWKKKTSEQDYSGISIRRTVNLGTEYFLGQALIRKSL